MFVYKRTSLLLLLSAYCVVFAMDKNSIIQERQKKYEDMINKLLKELQEPNDSKFQQTAESILQNTQTKEDGQFGRGSSGKESKL